MSAWGLQIELGRINTYQLKIPDLVRVSVLENIIIIAV